MANESNDNLNENGENKINKPKKDVNLVADCTSEFTKQYLKVSSGRVKFANDIMNSGDDIDPSTKALLSTFIASNSDKYPGVDLNKITVQMLRNKVGAFYFSLLNDKNTLRGKIINEYDISPKEFDSKIGGDLKNFDEVKVKNLIDSQKERDKYLKSKLGNSLQKKETISVLNKLTNEAGNKRFNSLSSEDQIEVGGILNNYRNGKKISDVDLKILFDSGIFTADEKKELVHTFIPTISLQRAIEINLIDENKAKDIKEKVLKKQISGSGFNSSETENILKNISFNDIDVSTSDFFPDKDEVEKLANGVGFKNMSNEFNSIIDDYNAEEDKKGPQNFEDFKKEFAKNPKHKGVEKLAQGSYIKITKTDKDGTKTEYFQKVVHKDILGKNKISLDGAGSGKSISLRNEPEEISYNKLLEALNQEAISVEVFTNDEIEDKIKNGSLKKVVNSYEPYKDGDLKTLGTRNLSKLTSDIDSIDPDGKEFGLSKGTVLYTKDGDTFTIDLIDESNSKITVINQGRIEEGSFQDLFEVFKSKEIKRKKSLSNVKEFLEESIKEGYDDWKGYEDDNGDIIYKENSTSKGIPLEYFTSKEGKYLKIVGNNKNGFEIEEGEYEETFEKDKDGNLIEDKKKNYIPKTNLELNYKKRKVTFAELQGLLKKNKLKPDYKFLRNPKDLEEKITPNSKNALQGSFLSKFLGNLSFNEIVMGGKMVVDGVTEFLKKANDIHAAKAARALGKFIPLGEFQKELEIKVESSEADAMQKEIDGLGKVDSPIATKRIREWLKNKDTPEHKKEAGLMFMLEKYGMLYAKDLYEDKGTFLFYTSFGGAVGDTLFMETKIKAKKEGATFTEEYLMHALLKGQCKKDTPYYPKRRSRLHKDFENKWKTGIEGEIEKGFKDASNKRTAKSALEGGIGELMGGTLANAVGWFKKSIDIGGSLADMSEGFFCMMYSGALYGVPQDVYKKIKGLWDGDKMPMIIARFASSQEEMNLFNDTVFELSKKIGKEYGDVFPDIEKEAKEIYDGAKNGSGTELQRIKKTQIFFKKYNEPLLNALNMRSHGDTKYSRTDKVLTFESERKNNIIFDKYYNKVKIYSTEGTFAPLLMNDGFKGTGISGMNNEQLVKDFLKFNSSGGFNELSNAENIWGDISNDLKATPNKIFQGETDVNSPTNRAKQKEYIVYVLKDVMAGFISNHGGSGGGEIIGELGQKKTALSGYNSPTLDIGTDLNNWKLNVVDSFGKIGASQIKKGDGDSELQRVADNIINGTKNSSSISYGVSKKVSDILAL